MGTGKASGAVRHRVDLRVPHSRSVAGIVLEERQVKEW